MSRFSDDGPDDLESLLAAGRWLGRRKAVLNGRPGKIALRRLEQALLQIPAKRLIEGSLCDGSAVCANGAWVYRHYVDSGMTPKEAWRKLRREARVRARTEWCDVSYLRLLATIGATTRELGITQTLAEVVALENDEGVGWGPNDISGQKRRYREVLSWVQRQV